MNTDNVTIYTDGSCAPNPGAGGWGAILSWNGQEKELTGGEVYTTNNRMELMALIAALEALKRPCTVTIYTDSHYAITSMTNPRTLWKRQLANGKTPTNVDLLQRLESAAGKHAVTWQWVKGHNGHPGNERADKLASKAMQSFWVQ
jgi:ribonuclease HI